MAKFILQSQKSDLRVGSDEFAINFKNQTGYDFNLTQSDYLKQGNLLRDYVTMQDETVMTKAYPSLSNSFSKLMLSISEDLKKLTNLDTVEEDLNVIKRKYSRDVSVLQINEQKGIEGMYEMFMSIANEEANNVDVVENRFSWKCKWYQWACVGASAAVAVGSIIATGGAAAAIYIVAGSITAVVACCWCGCKCDFSGTGFSDC
ncbi:MAG: hypothetical protein IPO37_17490 [Saprospiraceae bacterium]|nr:hypothetical protein [Saprospiraceae bacterium]